MAKETLRAGLFYSFVIFTLLCLNILSFFDFNIAYDLLKIFFIIVWFCIIFHGYRKKGVFSLYVLFIFFCMFFLYSRIFFDLINYQPLEVFLFFGKKTFDTRIPFKFVTYSILYLVFIDFGFYNSNKISVKKINLEHNKAVKNFLYCIFFFATFLFIYKSFLDIKMVQSVGYSADLDEIRVDYPFWLKGAGTLFYIGFYALLMCKLDKREIILIFSIYFICSLFSGLRGSRAAFLVPFIFMIYYLARLRIIKINLFKTLLLVLCAVSAIMLTTVFRGSDISSYNNFIDIFYYIFYGQGNTIGLPYYYLENQNMLEQVTYVPYILTDLFHQYFQELPSGGNLITRLGNIHGIEGIGLGESLFLELLNLNIFVSCLLCFFIGKWINYVDSNLTRNRILIPLFFSMASTIFYMPRNILLNFLNPFSILYFILTNFLIYFFRFICHFHRAKVCKNEF